MSAYRYVICCLCCLLMLPSAWAETIGLVSETRGQVSIITGEETQRAGLLDEIDAQVTLELKRHAYISVIYTASGHEYQLTGPGRYLMKAQAPQALDGGKVAKREPLNGALQGKHIKLSRTLKAVFTMRHITGVEGMLPPWDTTVLTQPALHFSWKEPANAEFYELQLEDAAGDEVYTSRTLHAHFVLPAKVTLKHDALYRWKVTAYLNNEQIISGKGKFRTAEREREQQAIKLRPQSHSSQADWVAYGLWLESQQLHHDAAWLWHKLGITAQPAP